MFCRVNDPNAIAYVNNTRDPCAITAKMYFDSTLHRFEAFIADGSIKIWEFNRDEEARIYKVYLTKAPAPDTLPFTTGVPNMTPQEKREIIASAPWVKILKAARLKRPMKCKHQE
jgi:hypothetical protein